jgi:hypothetical protein
VLPFTRLVRTARMSKPRAVPPLHGYLPAQPAKTYARVGRCIYCGEVERLSDEHIVPLGFGGRLLLPQASCSNCSAKTSKLERTCLRTMYGPLRLLYGLPSRRTGSRPPTLQLKVKKTEESAWEYVPVAQERYPFLITFPYFEVPGLLAGAEASAASGPVTKRLWIRGASPHHNFHELLGSLSRELGVHSLMPESKCEVSAFCSLLAKVALSYIVATMRVSTYGSPLSRIALGESMSDCLHYIGSAATDEPPSDALHEVSVGRTARSNSTVVRIRLLAKLGTPTYFVATPFVTSDARPSRPFSATGSRRRHT